MVSFVGIPVIIISEGNQNASYFISAAVIFTICCSILTLMYVPKYIALNWKKPAKQPRLYSKTSSALSADDEGINILWSPNVQADTEAKIKDLTKENQDQKAMIEALQKQLNEVMELGEAQDGQSFKFDDEGGLKMEA